MGLIVTAPLRHPVNPAGEGRQETAPPRPRPAAPAVVYLDLTTLNRLPEATAAAVTLDNFVSVVAAETERAEDEYLAGDHTAHRRAWEGRW